MIGEGSTVQDEDGGAQQQRLAVVAADPGARRWLMDAFEGLPDVAVVAWAEEISALLVLGTRLDVCLCAAQPPSAGAARLTHRGAVVVVPRPGEDPVTAVLRATTGRPTTRAGVRRPRLAPRQQEVMVAYVSGNDVLPSVARKLGVERETVKTHLRRIRDKYAQVGRPAPTRRDLYVRAVEDGLVPPPVEGRHQ
jgi:DNA-binding CsgD family transcriptional regulator